MNHKLLMVPVLLCAFVLMFSGVALATYAPGYAITPKQGEYGFSIDAEALGRSSFSGSDAVTYLVDVRDESYGAAIFVLYGFLNNGIQLFSTTHNSVVWYSETASNKLLVEDSVGNVYYSSAQGVITKLDIQTDFYVVAGGGSPVAWDSIAPPPEVAEPFTYYYNVDTFAINGTYLFVAYSLISAPDSETIFTVLNTATGASVAWDWGNYSSTVVGAWPSLGGYTLEWANGTTSVIRGDLSSMVYWGTSEFATGLELTPLDVGPVAGDILLGWNATDISMVDVTTGEVFATMDNEDGSIVALACNEDRIITLEGAGDINTIRSYELTYSGGLYGTSLIGSTSMDFEGLPLVGTSSLMVDGIGGVVLIKNECVGPMFFDESMNVLDWGYNATAGYSPDNTYEDGPQGFECRMHYFNSEVWYFTTQDTFTDQYYLVHADVFATPLEAEVETIPEDHDYSFLLLIAATVAFVIIGMSLSRGKGKL